MVRSFWLAVASSAGLLLSTGAARADTLGVFTQAGWNTPGLLGLGLAWRPHPRLELDGSLGLAGGGLAEGLEGRWLFSDRDGGAFAGLGLIHTDAGDVFRCHRAFDETHCSDTVAYHVGSSVALPVFVGWRTPDLWRLWASFRLGWSFLLAGGTLTPGAETPDSVDRAFDVPKGLVLGVAVGFRID